VSNTHSTDHTIVSGESSASLIERARAGDKAALDALCKRYVPLLMRWATGRLPRWTRDLSDTVDLVQETLLHTVRHLPHFEHRGEGALLAYLRQGVLNRIKDELRRTSRRPQLESLPAVSAPVFDNGPSPLEEAIGSELLERYEAVLNGLEPDERQAVIARLELGHSYPEIAVLLNKPSADAVRHLVTRALVRLARGMGHDARG
jgi:RNA polymerase sigma-70 factor, ECF subfamily